MLLSLNLQLYHKKHSDQVYKSAGPIEILTGLCFQTYVISNLMRCNVAEAGLVDCFYFLQ